MSKIITTQNLQGDRWQMKKILMEGDSAIIDGVEITYEEIKRAVIEQEKFNRLSDFLRNTLPNGEVVEWTLSISLTLMNYF